jgi:hypothetical protein
MILASALRLGQLKYKSLYTVLKTDNEFTLIKLKATILYLTINPIFFHFDMQVQCKLNYPDERTYITSIQPAVN